MQVGTGRQAGSELHAWRQFLGRSTLWLGVLLLGSGVICWVAANWPGMGSIQRFSLAQGLMAVSVLISIYLALRLRGTDKKRQQAAGAVLALSGLLLGAVLALLGQTYQTGADTWELFAWWAALLLPWALSAGSQVVWLLWCLIANVALALWISEHLLTWAWDRNLPGLLMAAANLVLLAVWEIAVRLRQVSTLVGPRVLALLALGSLVVPLTLGSFLGLQSNILGVVWLAVTLGFGYFYQRSRRDLVILAMTAAGVICVSLRYVAEWLMEIQPGAWAALPLAALLMAEAVWAANWLRRLGASAPASAATGPRSQLTAADSEPAGMSAGQSVDPADDVQPIIELADTSEPATAASAPWFIQGLLGLSAWLATILVLVFLVLSEIVMSSQGAMICGLILVAVGVAMVRASSALFWRQCAIALAFAGQLLVMFSFYQETSMVNVSLFVLAVGVAVYVLAPDVLLRFLTGGMIGLALTGLIWRSLMSDLEGGILDRWFSIMEATFLWLPTAVLGGWLAALAFCADRRLSRTQPHFLEPLAWSFVLGVQIMVSQATGVSADQLPALWELHRGTALLSLAGAILPAVAAAWLLWPRRHLLTRSLVFITPFALLVLSLFWLPSPGIALALTWLLLGFGLNKPRLTGFGMLSLLAYLMIYYYQLEVPLLQKALWLSAAAALLFLLRVMVWLVPRFMRTESAAPGARRPASPALRRRAAVFALGLLLVLGVVNVTIYQREQLLAHGQVAILQLAPVDPRSLMQGDYMALRFDAAGPLEKSRYEQDAGPTDGYLVLTPDAKGVARVTRIQDKAEPHDEKELVLRYRIRPGGVRLVTNAFFFPEGEAERYQAARYGEIRLDGHGTGLLVRMLGEDMQPL